jgi:hypothetical protein
MDNVARAFDRGNGKMLWHPSVPYRPTTSPVVLGGLVAIPGVSAEVRAFDTAGRLGGQIKLEASLAIAPAFSNSPGGHLMAAVTGGLDSQWKLSLLEQSRALPIVPLTEIPGISVPVGSPIPVG